VEKEKSFEKCYVGLSTEQCIEAPTDFMVVRTVIHTVVLFILHYEYVLAGNCSCLSAERERESVCVCARARASLSLSYILVSVRSYLIYCIKFLSSFA
jgi:hypothetical protein